MEGEGQVGLGADDTIPMPQPATLIDGVLADIMQRHGDKMVRWATTWATTRHQPASHQPPTTSHQPPTTTKLIPTTSQTSGRR